jgi:hypothetical protein
MNDKEYYKLIAEKNLHEMTDLEKRSVWEYIYSKAPDLFDALMKNDINLIKNAD